MAPASPRGWFPAKRVSNQPRLMVNNQSTPGDYRPIACNLKYEERKVSSRQRTKISPGDRDVNIMESTIVDKDKPIIDPEDKRKKAKKVVYVGLDNSGKTSLNLTLKQNLFQVGFVKPTYLVERETFRYLDYNIIQHDMGGQRKYIINYLSRPGKFFNKTDFMVFVIDIQDVERFDEALQYLSDVLERFDQLEVKPGICVLFHKAERYLMEADETELMYIEDLKGRITEAHGKEYDIEFDITSIYDSWSVNNAFGKIFNKIYPRPERLDALMKEITHDLKASVLAILDDNILPVASHSESLDKDTIIGYTAPFLYKLKENLKKSGETSSDLIVLQEEGYGFVFIDMPLAPVPLYLLAIGMRDIKTKAQVVDKIFDLAPRLYDALGITAAA